MNHITGPQPSTEITVGNRRITTAQTDHRTVQVQAADGKPINPCHPARARELLRKKRAIRVSRHPFTIRLLAQHQAESVQCLYDQEPT